MVWTVEVSDIAEAQLLRMGKAVRQRVLDYLFERIEGCKNPRHFGEALKANHAGLWRYRVGDYRVICEIQDERLLVLALSIDHRRDVYRS
ncbi:MAG: type II toxin-antitoxin system RelE/ParE family toxin [Pseudomonadota bacterium]